MEPPEEASGTSHSSSSELKKSEEKDEKFDSFYSEIKAIEKRDSTLTPSQQIERLNRPGATYFNLNPFDVLQVDPGTPLSLIKQKYRRLSLLVHPDKNIDDQERAQKAFEALNKSYKTLEDEKGFKRSQEVVEEAESRVVEMIKTKKKQLKKQGTSQDVPEDDPAGFRHAVYVQTCKLFADLERLRQDQEKKDMHERKRKAEEDAAALEKAKAEKEWNKNFEESRVDRVNSWRNFKGGPAEKKAKKAKTGFRPPKVKMEKR